MIETIAAVNQAVNSFIWGIPAMVCIIGVGLLLSVRTGFLQIRKFPYAIRTTVGRMFRKRDASDGAMTPFQAVCTALAGTVGTGNIAGVAGAIAIGGPGAVFWMWCSALLGMCTKFAEVTLAVHFRERSDTGEWVGGPMYYIKNGLGRRWQFLAVLYALFGVLTVFGTGNATQVNTIVAAVDTALLEYGLVGGSFLPTLNLIVGILVAVLVALVLLGGIKRIGSVSEKLVPFMALFYIVLSVGVVVLNFSRLPYVLESIVAGAFNPAAFTGGTIGSPGELKGKFLGTHALGSIGINGPNGVYGTLRTALPGETRELAFAQEVVPGEAEIWATTEGETPRAYKVRIEKVNDADPRRNMILRVTDPALLAKTGGIVQGMSGSPILQNGRLVGAVTHVLVNDPTRGYGIFAQTMLEQAQQAAKTDHAA
mgnify:CR=1 FL=1